MTPKQRFFVFVQNGIGAIVVNAVINGALGWAAVRGLETFPTWSGAAPDLAGTVFGVGFGTCLGVPFATRLDLRKGKLDALAPSPELRARIARLPSGAFKRALTGGLLSLAVFFPIAAALLALVGAPSFTPHAYLTLKIVFSAIQGAIITPPVAYLALAEGVPAARPVAEVALTAAGER
jgi:hypothetical protein